MLLEANNIHKVYDHQARRLEVLRGISLNIDEGEMISIVGPSGAGKSTLLHVLGGLDAPQEGQVTIDGEDIYQLKDQDRARVRNLKIGFVFQFYYLLPEFNALENVLLPALIKEDTGKSVSLESKAKDLLALVGLKDRMDHKPNQLSGGEQQRVAIARALINDPKIIFCDEPTGNLDSETGKSIVQLLMGLNKANKQTVILVTHDEGIAKLSKTIVRIKDGVLI